MFSRDNFVALNFMPPANWVQLHFMGCVAAVLAFTEFCSGLTEFCSDTTRGLPLSAGIYRVSCSDDRLLQRDSSLSVLIGLTRTSDT